MPQGLLGLATLTLNFIVFVIIIAKKADLKDFEITWKNVRLTNIRRTFKKSSIELRTLKNLVRFDSINIRRIRIVRKFDRSPTQPGGGARLH